MSGIGIHGLKDAEREGEGFDHREQVSISSTFFAHFFCTNVVLAAFFLCMYVRMYVKKAAETTFVRKKHAKNVDEIDGRFHRQLIGPKGENIQKIRDDFANVQVI